MKSLGVAQEGRTNPYCESESRDGRDPDFDLVANNLARYRWYGPTLSPYEERDLIRRAQGEFPGQTAEGAFIIENDTVTLTDRDGNPARDGDGKFYKRKLADGQNPKVIAGRLTRELRTALRGRRLMALTARSTTPKAAWYEAVHRLAHELGNCSGSVDDGILTVVTVDGRKSTQLGDLSPEGLTRILMGISN